METKDRIVVREFIYGEDSWYSTACVAGMIEEYTFSDNEGSYFDITFILNDGTDKISIDFTISTEDRQSDAIRAKKTLDKVACVLRTLREKLNELAYPEEPK